MPDHASTLASFAATAPTPGAALAAVGDAVAARVRGGAVVR
jgi:hypothetical protein